MFEEIFKGVLSLTWQQGVMFIIGIVLIALAIVKDYEPMLLLPIGFGAILTNLPFGFVWEHFAADGTLERGFLKVLYDYGISMGEIFPIFIFIAVGAMIDFSELIKNPRMIFFGAAAQFGIFFTVLAAILIGNAFPSLGIDLKTAAAIGIIGAADGPTSIYVANVFKLEPAMIAAITVAAYSYMSLVPIIQPPVIKAITTKKERMIRMSYHSADISKGVQVAFPIVVTIIAGLIAPESVPLIGALMFGNLIRVCGVLERLSITAQNELANLVTLVLGITIGASMVAKSFLTPQTLLVMGLGLVAFIFDTAGGVMFAKLMNLFTKEKINPMVGAAGISAFPMSSRIIQRMAAAEDPTNFVLMQSTSANISGQLGSVMAGSMILALVPIILR